MEIKKINTKQNKQSGRYVPMEHVKADATQSGNPADIYIPKSIQSSANYRPMTWDEYI